MKHYHVGSNIPGYAPDGEVLIFATLDEARAQLAASIEIDRAAYATDYPDRPVTITPDTDPDIPAGTSAWLTVGRDADPGTFSRYYWAGAEGDAGQACDCAGDAPISGGTWAVSYGEIWSGGDLAIMSSTGRNIATLVAHKDDADAEDVANAELLVRAPQMLALVRRIATGAPDTDPDNLIDDARQLLSELAAEWNRS